MESLKIKPYARLLTMLGEELIKSERIAIVELIKNSYDAFASWATVSFQNFDESFGVCSDSQILIEDDGDGMTEEIIKNHFLNPATPEKKQRKKHQTNDEKKRRILQGEKGIGRFAMFKLGSEIEIISRPKGTEKEFVIKYNFSQYNSDFIDSQEKALFLDDLNVTFEVRCPEVIIEKRITLDGNKYFLRKPHGTKIIIRDIRGKFADKTLDGICNDLDKMRPIFVHDDGKVGYNRDEFDVRVFVNGKLNDDYGKGLSQLTELVNEQTVFTITNGLYLEKDRRLIFKVNGKNEVIDFNDPSIRKNRIFKKYWADKDIPLNMVPFTSCGDFKFSFFVFDFEDDATGKCCLSKEDKELIRQHRVYLYRDGIRVYPYGDPDDDWLQIDIMRGLIKAGNFLSNDQIIGQIDITQEGNPDLRDKTSREGIIEKGNAFSDLVHLIQLFIASFKANQYKKYQIDKKRVNGITNISNKKVQTLFSSLKNELAAQPAILATVNEIENTYLKEREIFEGRIDLVESLAGVGLSVETASHDLMLTLHRLKEKILRMISSNYGKENTTLSDDLTNVLGMISFVITKMKDIQILFTSSKQKTKLIDVEEILNKILNIYRVVLEEENIKVQIIKKNNSPLMVRAIDAVLMQLLINLIDNSCFWLDEYDTPERKINIYLDGQAGKMVFADNGPGIKEDDIPYIFEAFFSRKGEEGRGLGLYIARRILERYDYSIDLITNEREKKLEGANFLVNFIVEG